MLIEAFLKQALFIAMLVVLSACLPRGSVEQSLQRLCAAIETPKGAPGVGP